MDRPVEGVTSRQWLMMQLDGSNNVQKEGAVKLLSRSEEIGGEEIDAIIAELFNTCFDVRCAASEGLTHIGAPAFSRLCQAAAAEPEQARKVVLLEAAAEVAEGEPDATSCFEAQAEDIGILLALLLSNDVPLRHATCRVLGQRAFHGVHTGASATLVLWLTDRECSLGHYGFEEGPSARLAMNTLTTLGGGIDALINGLTDPDRVIWDARLEGPRPDPFQLLRRIAQVLLRRDNSKTVESEEDAQRAVPALCSVLVHPDLQRRLHQKDPVAFALVEAVTQAIANLGMSSSPAATGCVIRAIPYLRTREIQSIIEGYLKLGGPEALRAVVSAMLGAPERARCVLAWVFLVLVRRAWTLKQNAFLIRPEDPVGYSAELKSAEDILEEAPTALDRFLEFFGNSSSVEVMKLAALALGSFINIKYPRRARAVYDRYIRRDNADPQVVALLERAWYNNSGTNPSGIGEPEADWFTLCRVL